MASGLPDAYTTNSKHNMGMKRKYNAPEVEIIQSQITSILAASEEGEFPGEGGAKAFNGFGDDEEETILLLITTPGILGATTKTTTDSKRLHK